MGDERRGGLWPAIGWFLFPVIPVVLARWYHELFEWSSNDPFVWTWKTWLVKLSPLIGFGFLAGATLAIADDLTPRRRFRGWLARRSLWVAVGPWSGLLFLASTLWVLSWLESLIPLSIRQRIDSVVVPWRESNGWTHWIVGWIFWIAIYAIYTSAWILPAFLALRRARRVGAAWDAFQRGLTVSLAFVGSLFGSYWAITQIWRDYFFDARVVPLLLAMISLATLSGCGGTVTYGEVRRHDLFGAMLVAWVFGLALIWRWLSRRTKPPGT